MEQSGEPKGRSRAAIVAATVGVAVAIGLVMFGLLRADDDRPSGPTTPSTIGAIQAPAEVLTTQPGGAVSLDSTPVTADLPVAPIGTSDIPGPTGTADIPAP